MREIYVTLSPNTVTELENLRVKLNSMSSGKLETDKSLLRIYKPEARELILAERVMLSTIPLAIVGLSTIKVAIEYEDREARNRLLTSTS